MKDQINHLDLGSGETVVLLPSSLLTAYSYSTLAKMLAKKYRVIVPDLYRGLSKQRGAALEISNYVDSLHLLIMDLNIRTFYLIGISSSGLTALEYLSKHSRDLKKVILVSIISTPLISDKNKVTILSGIVSYTKILIHNFTSKKGIKINFRWLFDSFFNFLVHHPLQFFVDPLIAVKAYLSKPLRISVPTKIILAREDEFIPYNQVHKNIKIKNLEIDTVEGGHAWFFLNEEIFVKKVEEFFN